MKNRFEVRRKDFPFLKKEHDGGPLIYFDNAATSQKPQQMIDVVADFYAYKNANIHRTIYTLAEEATVAFESVRVAIAELLGAHADEIIFTKGTTESINFIAQTWAREHIHAGDEIVITALEHHANILPWQRVVREQDAVLKIIPLDANGTLDMQAAQQLITKKTKLVSVVHVSNVLGTHVDVQKLAEYAHAVGARVLVDAAQSVPHQAVNVKELGCDFLAFSAHKMLGPTGLGVLYIKKSVQDQVPPFLLGGGMVFEASYSSAKWLHAPRKYEAGTPPIAEVIGFGASLKYMKDFIPFDALQKHEAELCARTIEGLLSIPDVQVLGPLDDLKQRGHLVTFTVDNVHAHDVAAYLDQKGICVRAGHQCAQPLARELGLDAAVRVSFHCYNTSEEVDYFLQAIQELEL